MKSSLTILIASVELLIIVIFIVGVNLCLGCGSRWLEIESVHLVIISSSISQVIIASEILKIIAY